MVFKEWFEPIHYLETFPCLQLLENDRCAPTSGWQRGDVRNTVTVHEEFAYGQKRQDDEEPPSDVYFISIRDDHDHVFLTGPESVYGLKDFTYTAWLRRLSTAQDQLFEYGILVSPEYIDAEAPDVDDVYTFQMRLGYNGAWVVKKWDIFRLGSRSGTELETGQSGKIIESARWWNVFQIERIGDTLHFRIANQNNPSNFSEVATVTDPNMPVQMYVGFYAAHPGITTEPWREYQFDNVTIVAEP
jgi:hypothetical protein